MPAPLFGGIEAGGTRFRCCVGRPEEPFVAQTVVPTGEPEPTLAAVRAFFTANGPVDALGIATFGPVDVDPASPDFGTILMTPKLPWQGVNLIEQLGLPVPVGLHTDVVGAALAEWAALPTAGVVVYVTVGTGIGAGVVINGKPLSVRQHSEFGHIYVPRHPDDLSFAGVCPFHGDCLEGLASGPALTARWGQPAHQLADSRVWEIQAWYLAQACTTLIRTLVPDHLVLGGGLLQRPGLLRDTRRQMNELLGDYHVGNESGAAGVLTAPLLNDDAGLRGALQLAREVSENRIT